MSNNWDNSPEFDYNELRRQREEYMQRKRMANQPAQPAAEEEAPAARKVPVQPVQPVQEEQEAAAPAAEQHVRDAFEEAIEEGYEDYADEDFIDDEAEDAANPNPFDSFIHFFHGMKNSASKRRGKKDDPDELDGLTDEELAALADENAEDAPVRTFGRRMPAQSEEDDVPGEAADIETGFSEGAAYSGEDFDDEDYGEIFEDEAPRKSGFKKFVNLFVTRIDEEDEEEEDEEDFEDYAEDPDDESYPDDEDDEDEEDIQPAKRKGLFGRKLRREKIEEDDYNGYFDQSLQEMPIVAPKGEDKMDDLKKTTPEAAPAPAAESVAMTRRERRELAMRMAAEEDARKAQQEATKDEIIPAAVQEEKVDMAAFQDAPADTEVIVETTAREAEAPAVEIVDEPTREFKPVSLRDLQEIPDSNLFDLDSDEDDDEDEEEIEEKKPRFSLFCKKRAKVEDEDDEDDEDDYDDEDEEDEEEIEEKPRRGLFGRKRARIEEEDDEEDEDDEDEYDEYDDEDDDEYDEYDDEDDEDEEDDDDYDDEDEFDYDDEPRRSFGHHLLRVITIILAFILVLLVAVCGVNFEYYLTGDNIVITKAHEILGDSSAFELFCFSHTMRENMVIEDEIIPETVIEAEITAIPTAEPVAEATVAVPSLDGSAPEAAQSAVELAPVVEEAPVTAGSVG